MDFTRELTMIEESEKLSRDVEASLRKRASPVLEALMRVERREDARKFALKLPRSLFKAAWLGRIADPEYTQDG